MEPWGGTGMIDFNIYFVNDAKETLDVLTEGSSPIELRDNKDLPYFFSSKDSGAEPLMSYDRPWISSKAEVHTLTELDMQPTAVFSFTCADHVMSQPEMYLLTDIVQHLLKNDQRFALFGKELKGEPEYLYSYKMQTGLEVMGPM